MKRCPKCNRSFPEDSQKFCTVDGGLLITEQNFDPNATIRSTSSDLGVPPGGFPSEHAATSRKLPDLGETIALSSEAAKAHPTNPSSAQTASELPRRSQQQPPIGATTAPGVLPPAKKKSKLPLILGILAVLLILGIAGIAAAFFFVIKPRLDEMQDRPVVVVPDSPPTGVTNTNTTTGNTNSATLDTEPEAYVPPAGATKFTNSKDNLDGRLAEHYVDFSFYYPKEWQPDPKAGVAGANNFARVERVLPPDFTQEEFAVSWYGSKGTFENDLPAFPKLVELLSSNLAKRYPEYRKVSEGPTKINSVDAYEFRFESLSKGTEKGDIQIWGRVAFLPTGIPGETSGVTLSMLATSLAPELTDVDDVGDKGQMPMILESFRFEKK